MLKVKLEKKCRVSFKVRLFTERFGNGYKLLLVEKKLTSMIEEESMCWSEPAISVGNQYQYDIADLE